MTVAHQHRGSRWAAALDRIKLLDIVALVFFVIAVIAIWTKTSPFFDQRVQLLTATPQSSDSRKVIMLAIAAGAGLLVLLRGQFGTLRRFADPLLFAVLAWFALTSLHSQAPKLGFDRLALAAVVIGIAASLPLIFNNLQDFAGAYGAAVSAAIVLSLAGVILVPELTIHSVMDAAEQTLAGDWRGIFPHKNDLAPMTNQFIFVGVLLARMKKPIWGAAVVVGAAILLVESGGKSAALTIPLALVGSWAIVRARSFPATLAVAFGAVGGLAVLTLGSVMFPWASAIVHALLHDPTFTGRTDYWKMGLQAIAAAPVFGYGYTTFFDLDVLRTFAAANNIFSLPEHAHNGYLGTLLSGGFPALVLVLVWVGYLPLKYIWAIKTRVHTMDEAAFLDFLVQSWLNMLLISSLESPLFNRGDPVWFGGLLGIVCLRYWFVSGGPSDATRPVRAALDQR